MRITRYADIGLRVLIYLSKADAHRAPATVAEIARQFDIPVNHLVKVAGQLARVGWVQSLRGRNGGLLLGVDASTLRIGTVLRELEGDAELVDCEGLQCRLSHDCRLRGALAAGLRAFYEAMDRYTLADLTRGASGEQIIRMHRNFLRSSKEHDDSATT
ncbi:Rrf2 family transcriptional regulator [Noviherbaspirillum cavernae]|uniref:Rrf2 family transcriptional regulator n=1 Tax=Noviherbaspirillum cavernae TaxID=2320862 RepID=A0A418WXV8_9BURK|nr:Rrf2 family transcriptional regulator [Noviherbaspirillum cavernae]RJG05037.1 Rrf2 family transcriptional regulator [Noviherbaspirillum cavernae]